MKESEIFSVSLKAQLNDFDLVKRCLPQLQRVCTYLGAIMYMHESAVMSVCVCTCIDVAYTGCDWYFGGRFYGLEKHLLNKRR